MSSQAVTTVDFPAIFAQGWALPKPDGFLDHFMPMVHRDATFTQPGFPAAVGHDQIQRMFRRLFTLLPDLNTVPTRSATCGDAVFIESECRATLGGAMIAFSVCDRFVIRGGLIIERRSFSDPTPVLLAALGRPTGWVRLVRSRL
jgi:limonene-1,2-epoxide hydrolase